MSSIPNNKSSEELDMRASLIYWNSTAVLMETQFKNMRDEDFVYPPKRKVNADEGAIIRSEEHLRRQQEHVENNYLMLRDPYLESVLAKMSDEDFTYETKKPKDPNYGRVVRALELMGISQNVEKDSENTTAQQPGDANNEEKLVESMEANSSQNVEIKKENFDAAHADARPNPSDTKETEVKTINQKPAVNFRNNRGYKNFDYNKQTNRGRNRGNCANNGSRRGSFNSPTHKQADVDNHQTGTYHTTEQSYNRPHYYDATMGQSNASHFYENHCFSTPGSQFPEYTAGSATFHPIVENTGVGSFSNMTYAPGSTYHGGRGNRSNNGCASNNGNRGGRRRINGYGNNRGNDNQKSWSGKYDSNQMSWRVD